MNSAYIDNYFYGFNPLDSLFHHAIYGKMFENRPETFLSPYNGTAAIVYFICSKEKTFVGKISGLDQLEKMPFVVSILQYFDEGDYIDGTGFTDVVILGVHIVGTDFSDIKAKTNLVYNTVDFFDPEGNSIILPHYNLDCLEDAYQ